MPFNRPLLRRCHGVRLTRLPAAAAAVLLAALLSPASAAPRKAAAPASAAAPVCRPDEPSFFRDEGLSMKVATKLQFAKGLLREKINVKVTGRVAMLWGGVSSAEAIATAGRIASQVDGIVCIDNRLKVGPPEVPDREATRP